MHSLDFFFSPLVEHTLSLAVQLYGSTHCTNNSQVDVVIFFKQNWPQIYKLNGYDGGVRGISGEILNYYCVLQWVFMDILIIAITICLSTRLYQLNEHMKQYTGMVRFDLINKSMWGFKNVNTLLYFWEFRKCHRDFGVRSGNALHPYRCWSQKWIKNYQLSRFYPFQAISIKS